MVVAKDEKKVDEKDATMVEKMGVKMVAWWVVQWVGLMV